MRMGWIKTLGAMGVGCVISCGAAWAMPLKGDVGAVDEPLKGGIDEGLSHLAAVAGKSGNSACWIQRECVGYSLKYLELKGLDNLKAAHRWVVGLDREVGK